MIISQLLVFGVSATGYPQLVTQMYFRGDSIEDNEFVQELNKQDLLLQGQGLTEAQRDELIVEFNEKIGAGLELHGNFNITLKR